MRYFNRRLALLFVISMMSSCTCHQQVEETAKVPSSLEHPVGFGTRPTAVVFVGYALANIGFLWRLW